MHTIEQVEELRTKARAHVHNMVQLAYDAGRQRGDAPGDVMRPSAHTVNSAVDHVELAAVKLAHARMEETAKRCGFEGLTEALGYLITLRDNPVASLLREAVNLAALGDIDENTEAYGWGHWYKRAKAVVGDTAPPPETIKFETHDEVAIERRDLDPAGTVAIGVSTPRPADNWDYYRLPRTHVHEVPRDTYALRYPIYFWAGREGRPSSHSWFGQLPAGGELVVVDETRGDPNGPAPICRIVSGLDPFFLGHTICISREELKPVDASYKPLGGATTN